MNGNRIFVFDSDFFIRYRDYLWNVKAFYPVQRQFEMLLKNCYGHVFMRLSAKSNTGNLLTG